MSGKRALIRGTAILTITSFVTRFMGFFYRIFFKIIVYIKEIYIIARCLSQCNFLYMPLASLFPVPEPNLLFPAALHRKMLQAIRKKQKNY